MISDLQPVPVSSLPVVSSGNSLAIAAVVTDVKAYLAKRVAGVPSWELEKPLFDRLPLTIRGEVRRLQAAMLFVRNLTTGKRAIKVQPACERALTIYAEFRPLKTFRAKFDAWLKCQDWLCLVNRAKAGSDWQAGERGLPDAFLEYVAARMASFRRGDAREQAILSIKRQWQTGRTHKGVAEPVKGYETGWEARNVHVEPDGWHTSNIRRQMKRREKFSKAVQAYGNEGSASARKYIPQVHGTRVGLRFLEMIQFDDVRCDFRIMDTESGQVNDLWLLIARDVATGMLLGFGMRPARSRDDGTQEHLKLQDMKQLCGWLLETYGLPPWQMIWVMENGTATLAEAVRAALREMIGEERIDFQMATMIGGRSAMQYWEKAVGNSKAKAMLESLNRLMHMMASHFPGQIGLNYSKQPTELRDREKEALEIWRTHSPEDRANCHYPFYTIPQARDGLFEIFRLQNSREAHRMEGFQEIAEWLDQDGWKPAATAPADMTNVQTRTRMESPLERAKWLVQNHPGTWSRVSPEVLTVFYEHTMRTVKVTASGEIEFMSEGRKLGFQPAAPEFALAAERKVIAYFNPDDPRFLTLTDGRGGILGTWLRIGLVKAGDREALAAASRHSQAALAAVKERATELAAGDRTELEAMRAHNAGFVTVVEQTAIPATTPISAVARSVRAVAAEKKVTEKQQRQTAAEHKLATDVLGF